MIEEQFVSFGTARMLKEAGFDVPCTSQYTEGKCIWNVGYPNNFNQDEFGYSRPTQSLAARWLREVHRISVDAAFMAPSTNIDVWQYFIGKMDDMIWPGDFETSERTYATYEEAMESGLQEAVKLIKK